MEVAKITTNSVRIKSKLGVFAIDPIDTKGTLEADAVLFLNRTLTQQDINAESSIVIINGPGEYEIKSVKFTGVGRGNLIAYFGKFDSIDTFVVKASTLNIAKEVSRECQIAIIEADVIVEQSAVAATNASIIIFYGDKSMESVAALGKSDIAPVNKFSISRDKLPTEVQVVVIG